jgi:hypothetical protein
LLIEEVEPVTVGFGLVDVEFVVLAVEVPVFDVLSLVEVSRED